MEIRRIEKDKIDKIIKEAIDKVANEEIMEYHEPLLEMARIDDPNNDSRILGTKEIWVYGNDRSSMTPHFHYLDKCGNPQFNIEIRIEDLTLCHSSPRKGISKNLLLTWEGLSDAQKALKTWLESPNSDIPSVTNYRILKVAWNQNNRNNKIDL